MSVAATNARAARCRPRARGGTRPRARALPHRDRVAVDLGEHLDVVAVLGDPRRADEDRVHRRRTPSISRSASNERTWRPNALRLALKSSRPRWSRSSMISPAQVPSTGVPERTRSRSGSARPSRSIPSVIVVDSPPGMTSPSRPSRSAGTRTSRTSAPSAARIRACASKPPWSARTPTSGAYQPRLARSCCSSSLRVSSDAIAVPRPSEARRPARGRGSASWPRRSPRRAAPGPRT